jgi:hypothetical protein
MSDTKKENLDWLIKVGQVPTDAPVEVAPTPTETEAK